MPRVEFWRDIEARFRALQSRSVPVHRVPWHDDSLHADWLSTGWSDTGDQWRISGADPIVKKNFEWFAERAAVELGHHGGGRSAVVFWLELLRRDSPNYKVTGSGSGDNGLTRDEHGKIERVCEASADYCLRLETQDRLRGASNAQSVIIKSERTLTETQQRKITDAEQQLKDNLDAHEKMREILDPGEWQRVAPLENAPTIASEIPKLERDIKTCAVVILGALADASWVLGSTELFRARLEVDSRNILEWVRTKVNKKDLPLLDWSVIERAVNQEASTWIDKAQREFPPPWTVDAPAGVPPGLIEPQGPGFQERDQLGVLDPFQHDANARPLGDNRFPANHPAHEAFEEATWETKQEIGQLQSRFLAVYKTPAELLEAFFKYRTGHFDVVAKQGACVVGNDETARRYESWIDDLAKFYLEDTLSRINGKVSEVDPAAPPFFNAEDLASFKRDLTLELMRIVSHYKTEAASIALRIKRGPAKTATEKPNGPGDSSERRFKKTGDVWSLQFEVPPVSMQHRIGMAYIAHLLRSPGRSFNCMELRTAVYGNSVLRAVLDKQDEAELPVPSFMKHEILDPTALKQYKDRRDFIEAQLRQAELNNDSAQRERLEAEKQMLIEQIKAATGLGGRHRTFAPDSEKARKAVARAIGTALTKIGEHHPELAKHLGDRIERGGECCYKSDGIGWEV